MHPFVTQALARQHQESLMNEVEHERLTRQVDKQSRRLSTQPIVLEQKLLSEPDFAAIRRDLRSTLTEWCLESRTEGFEEMIDTFMRRLKRHLGQREQRRETGVLR
jgi:phosphotransacetylase